MFTTEEFYLLSTRLLSNIFKNVKQNKILIKNKKRKKKRNIFTRVEIYDHDYFNHTIFKTFHTLR